MILAGQTIANPHDKTVTDDVISIIHKTMSGKRTRDFIGASKKIFECQWSPMSNDDYDKLWTHFVDQRDNGTTKVLNWGEVSFVGPVIIVIGDQSFPIPNNYTYRNIKVTFIEA